MREDGPARLAAASMSGASAEVAFSGTGIVWHTAVGPAHGTAALFVDGAFERTVDTRASVPRVRDVRVGGLQSGVHTLRIVVLPTAEGTPTEGSVSIDGFTVLG